MCNSSTQDSSSTEDTKQGVHCTSSLFSPPNPLVTHSRIHTPILISQTANSTLSSVSTRVDMYTGKRCWSSSHAVELIRTASWTVVCPYIAGGDESLEAVLAVLVDVYAIPMFPDRGIVLQVHMSHWLRWLNSVRIHVVVVESLVRGTITRCRPD